MKTRLAVISFLFLFMGTSSALANSYTYSLTEVFEGVTQFSWTTAPIPGITVAGTTVPLSDIASDYVDPATSYDGGVITGLILGGSSEVEFNPSGDGTSFYLPLADFTAPGTYAPDCGGAVCTMTVTETTSATPEPSPILLLGTGILGLFLMTFRRRRLA